MISPACIIATGLSAMLFAAEPASQDLSRINGVVLYHAFAFGDGGGYQWKSTGTPEEILFKETRILDKSESGTYCCGYTFAVAMRAAAELEAIRDKSADEIITFQKQWYGAVSDETIREIQCATALERLGIGKRIAPEQARPGDFVQFWRGKSGHSVIFLGWIRDDNGKQIGLRYRSSQKATDGIGCRQEYFTGVDGHDGKVDPERIYVGRLTVNP